MLPFNLLWTPMFTKAAGMSGWHWTRSFFRIRNNWICVIWCWRCSWLKRMSWLLLKELVILNDSLVRVLRYLKMLAMISMRQVTIMCCNVGLRKVLMFWLPFYESCRKTIYSCLPCLPASDGAYGETVTATSGEYSNDIADYGGAVYWKLIWLLSAVWQEKGLWKYEPVYYHL